MDLKYLTTFQTIVEEGSFTAAADKLHYTQSTITFQMDQLEQELSVRLFEKIGRKMVLTAAGKELIPHVKEVFQAVGKLQYLNDTLASCEGELHIGVAETYLCYRLPPALKAFVSKAPRARLFIRSMNCYDIRNQLINGSLDAGIFYQEVGGYSGRLTAFPIESFPVTLAASPAVARRFADFTTPGQQHKIPLIINEPDCIFRQIFENYLKDHEIILDHTIELASIATIKNLVQNDIGVSFLPRFTIENELAAGTLTEIKTNVKQNQLTIVYAHHKNKWISPLQQLFIDCLSDHKTYLHNGLTPA